MAVDEGHDLRSILGLETAIGGRWSRERPKKYSLIELLQMFGDKASPSALGKAVELGLLERHGLSFVSGNPTALAAGATMAKEGIPLADLLERRRHPRPHFNAVAKAMVGALVVRQLDRYEADALPPPADVPALVDAIWRVRPLAMVLVETEMNRALEEAPATISAIASRRSWKRGSVARPPAGRRRRLTRARTLTPKLKLRSRRATQKPKRKSPPRRHPLGSPPRHIPRVRHIQISIAWFAG